MCEPLPSDKFNNSDKFTDSLLYHHFSIPVSTNSLLLSLLFQGHQNFSQNSVRSTIVFCTRQFVHDVFIIAQNQACKIHGVTIRLRGYEEEEPYEVDAEGKRYGFVVQCVEERLFKHVC